MKIINDNKLFLFLLMWFGVLINFNSHYNDIYKFYDIFFSKWKFVHYSISKFY